MYAIVRKKWNFTDKFPRDFCSLENTQPLILAAMTTHMLFQFPLVGKCLVLPNGSLLAVGSRDGTHPSSAFNLPDMRCSPTHRVLHCRGEKLLGEGGGRYLSGAHEATLCKALESLEENGPFYSGMFEINPMQRNGMGTWVRLYTHSHTMYISDMY